MSGETEQEVSGWTVDTLHQQMRSLIGALDTRTDDRFIANEKAMQAAFDAQQEAMRTALSAADKAVSAALAAQEKAIDTALTAANKTIDVRQTYAEREFHEHLDQYRHEVDTAFRSSDRAITKAEIATEKRFEAVNEFRAQLSDQAARFISRTEFDSATDALRAEQVSAAARNAERIQALTDRLNRSEGKGIGLNAGWIYVLGFIAAIGTIISLYLAFKGGG